MTLTSENANANPMPLWVKILLAICVVLVAGGGWLAWNAINKRPMPKLTGPAYPVGATQTPSPTMSDTAGAADNATPTAPGAETGDANNGVSSISPVALHDSRENAGLSEIMDQLRERRKTLKTLDAVTTQSVEPLKQAKPSAPSTDNGDDSATTSESPNATTNQAMPAPANAAAALTAQQRQIMETLENLAQSVDALNQRFTQTNAALNEQLEKISGAVEKQSQTSKTLVNVVKESSKSIVLLLDTTATMKRKIALLEAGTTGSGQWFRPTPKTASTQQDKVEEILRSFAQQADNALAEQNTGKEGPATIKPAAMTVR